jgi:hypothetical protein
MEYGELPAQSLNGKLFIFYNHLSSVTGDYSSVNFRLGPGFNKGNARISMRSR